VGDAERGIIEAPKSAAINALRNMREPLIGASLRTENSISRGKIGVNAERRPKAVEPST
jgi:hypothetical protein